MDYAILVGINAYPYPNTLRGCLNDVADVRAELVNAYGFSDGSITTITDAEATADRIKQALEETVVKLQKDDRFVFWYSGHGAQLVDGNAATDCICPVDFDFTPPHAVTVDDFHATFGKIKPGVIAVWGSDSCHSGDLERDMRRNGVPKLYRRDPAHAPKAMARVSKTMRGLVSTTLPNIALVSGCRSDQTSADASFGDRPNGAFTYYFLRALGQGGATVPLTRLVPQLDSALHDNGYTQTPELSGPPAEVERRFLR